MDGHPHLAEHRLDRQSRLAGILQEGLGEGAVLARAVRRGGAGRGREGDEGAALEFDPGEARFRLAGIVEEGDGEAAGLGEAVREGIVAAGVEDQDLGPDPGAVEALQDLRRG